MKHRGVAVKMYGLVLLGAIAFAAPASAQEPPPVVPPPSPVAGAPAAQQTPPPAQPPSTQAPLAQTPPVAPTTPAAAPVVPPVAATVVDPQRRRAQIRLMEGLLAQAVRNGAEETAKVIRSRQPGLMLFTGDARARGVFLENYGIFFHVEIPGVRPSVASIVEMIEAQRNEALRNAQPRTMSGGAPMAPVFDPNGSYTEAVQRQLIDAMLDFRIDLRPDEWLTIAARDADGPLAPGEIYESITLILQVKGSDLAEFAAGRLSRADARARVQVKEF